LRNKYIFYSAFFVYFVVNSSHSQVTSISVARTVQYLQYRLFQILL